MNMNYIFVLGNLKPTKILSLSTFASLMSWPSWILIFFMDTLPKTDISPENWWLEDHPFLLGNPIFRCLQTVSFRCRVAKATCETNLCSQAAIRVSVFSNVLSAGSIKNNLDDNMLNYWWPRDECQNQQVEKHTDSKFIGSLAVWYNFQILNTWDIVIQQCHRKYAVADCRLHIGQTKKTTLSI